jgi:hypothetical protein
VNQIYQLSLFLTISLCFLLMVDISNHVLASSKDFGLAAYFSTLSWVASCAYLSWSIVSSSSATVEKVNHVKTI